MKRPLEKDNTSYIENTNKENEPKYKIFKHGDIILVDDVYNIRYYVKSKTEIFTRHYTEMNCPYCQKNIKQYIGMYDYIDPELIKFFPEVLTNHLRKEHFDKFVAIKNSNVDLSVKYCELVITKKVVL